MGIFHTSGTVVHVVHRERLEVVPGLLVDTGSEYTWVPRKVLEGLGIDREKKDLAFVMANGQQVTRSVGFAIIYVEGHFTIDEVVFAEDGDLPLLGARTLEGLNLTVDPSHKRLVAAGPLPAAVARYQDESERRSGLRTDGVDDYRRIIRDLIREYAQYESSVGDVRNEVIFDDANGHYELAHTGWVGDSRVHGSVLHIDIRDGYVWIEHNGTEDSIGTRLVEAGIPRDRIVLGFKPPESRRHTGFASV